MGFWHARAFGCLRLTWVALGTLGQPCRVSLTSPPRLHHDTTHQYGAIRWYAQLRYDLIKSDVWINQIQSNEIHWSDQIRQIRRDPIKSHDPNYSTQVQTNQLPSCWVNIWFELILLLLHVSLFIKMLYSIVYRINWIASLRISDWTSS